MPTQNDHSQQTNLWTQIVRTKICSVFFFLLICAISSPAWATVSKQFHFEWEYDINLPGLAGYILYQNDQHLLTINDPATLSVDFNVELEPGQTVVFTMKAFDVNGNESAVSAPYSFNVPAEVVNDNFIPEAYLNLSTWDGEAPLAVDFFAEGSTDFDGTIVSYSWDFGDGASAGSSTASHNYTFAGEYTVTLTVTDNDGATDTAQTTVTVSALPPNIPPEAYLNLSTWDGEAPLAVEFFAEGSTDSDGTIVSYSWDFGDGASAGSSTASHSYTFAGEYTVTLTVTDNDGATATAQTTVTVSTAPANMVPTALFYMTPDSGIAPLDVSFTGAYSTDDDGTITSYLWNFGDGNSATGVNVSHVYTTAGSFTVKLTVTDDKGAQATYDGVLVVEAANVSLPTLVAAFSINPQTPTVKDVVQFSGSDSTSQDGDIVYYLWDFGDGKSANGVSVSHQYIVPGTYTVKLTVWDNYNNSSQKSVALTVNSLGSPAAQDLAIQRTLDAIRSLLLKKPKK